MNYYEHHLGDYLRDTAHLSMLEDGAYRRLIDAYYIREAPLPVEMRDVFRLVRAQSKQDREAVETVLREFFTETPDGWKHGRCEREIERFQDKQRKAKASAAARWERKPQQSEGNADAYANASPDAMRTHSEGNAPRARPQTPDTRHQTPEEHPPTPRKRGSVHEFPPGFEAFWAAYPRKTAKPAAAKAFARLKADDALLRSMLSAIDRQRRSPQWTKDEGEFIPHPATWLNGRRWEDGEPQRHAPADDIFAGAK